MMEATKYVEINESGSAVISGTRIHVETVAEAYTGGFSEEEILDWLKIDKVQFHGALAYYYEHETNIQKRIQARIVHAESAGNVSQNTLEKLRKRKNK